MIYTLAQAGKAAGRTRQAILSAIKKGTISAAKNGRGEWEIDASELHRVYPFAGKQPANDLPQFTPSKSHENEDLQAHLELLQQLINELKEDKAAAARREEDARQREARLNEQVDEMRRLAAHFSEQVKQLTAPPPQDQGGEVIEAEATRPQDQGGEVIEPEPAAAIQRQDRPHHPRTWGEFWISFFRLF